MPVSVLEIETAQPEEFLRILSKNQGQGGLGELTAELYGSIVHVFTPHPESHIRKLLSLAQQAGISIQTLTEIDPSLEDVFIACMQSRDYGGNHEN